MPEIARRRQAFGAGKTFLVRAIAAELGANPHEGEFETATPKLRSASTMTAAA